MIILEVFAFVAFCYWLGKMNGKRKYPNGRK
jgi:hypothetical protein